MKLPQLTLEGSTKPVKNMPQVPNHHAEMMSESPLQQPMPRHLPVVQRSVVDSPKERPKHDVKIPHRNDYEKKKNVISHIIT